MKIFGRHIQTSSTHVIGVFVFITLLLIAISTTALLWDLRKRELEHARVETISLTRMFMEQTEQSFASVDGLLLTVQERMRNNYGSQFELDSLPIHLLMSTRAAGVRQVKSMFVVNAQGLVVNTSRDIATAQFSVQDRAYFKAFASEHRQGLFIDKPLRNRIDNHWTLYMARRLTAANGSFRGVLVAAVDIPQFEQLYNFMKLDYLRPIAIYLADGTLVASLPHRENMVGEKTPELTDAEIQSVGNDVTMVEHTSGDGGQQIFAIGRVQKFPLLVSVTNDQEQTLASWRETGVPITFAALLTSVFMLFVAAFMVRKLRQEEVLTTNLRDATDRYHHTIDSVMDAVVAVDESLTIRLFNPAAELMFGYKAEYMLGRPLSDLMPKRSRAGHDLHVGRFMRSDVASRAMSLAPQLDITGLRSDGSEFPIESTISQTWIGQHKQLTAVLRDVTQRRRAEAEVYRTNQQLRELSAALQNVREEERTRIARELHDELGQQLTGLKLDLSWLANRLKEGREANPDKVLEMRQALDAAIVAVRRISTELRPLILDDLGFGEAVTWQAAEIQKRSGLKIALDLPAAHLVQRDDLATALFRIVQESLTNVVRHAQATEVHICLVSDESRLVLTVSDNGQGLAPDLPGGGIGLVSMRERAMAFGGVFSVRNNTTLGTTVEVALPLSSLEALEEPS